MVDIYKGVFASEEGVEYEVVIRSVDESAAGVGELIFAGDAAVCIEWAEVDKLAAVQGSSMTLRLVSEEDRKYVELYTVEPGAIVAEVRRDGALYWTGALDAELYEEPYAWKRDYEVEFTFSDFALLERKSWDKTGVSTMEEIVETCLAAAGLGSEDVVKKVSTERGGSVIDMGKLYLLNENFYDEDGEAKTYREVLEAVLQPFALRMVQKGGKVYVYDLNALYDGMESEEVWWKSDDAVLGVDVVYNDVTVTFSPYADSTLIDGSMEHDDVLPDVTGKLWLMDNDWKEAADGFRMAVGEQSGLGLTLANGAKFARIDSEYSGNDEACVVCGYRGNVENVYDTVYGEFARVHENGVYASKEIITTGQAFLGYVSYKRTNYKLKVELSVLFDVRYNPFESAASKNEEGNWDRLNDWANFGYVPVMLNLKDASGRVLYHYENSGVMLGNGYGQSACRWVAGEGKWGCMYLAYYDFENRKSATGFGGWKKNRQIIGYYRDDLPKKWSARGEGEYIELPPTGGWLELQVGRGVHQFDYKREEKDIWSRARWLMYKDATVTVVNSNGTSVEQEDVEDTAWVNRRAKEGCEIETIVGTLGTKVASASARGLVMDGEYKGIAEFSRAGVTDRLERLLIGTVYSQYASRKATLSGTVRLLPEVKVLTDESTSGRFVLLSEVQDLMQDESEVKMVEFVADNYEGIEYE
jgi:hypothetical protein